MRGIQLPESAINGPYLKVKIPNNGGLCAGKLIGGNKIRPQFPS